jgi:hypothetical protein
MIFRALLTVPFPSKPGLLFKAFCALQSLATAIRDGIDDPVPLLFTNNEILFFKDSKMVGKFGIRNINDSFDDTDTKRLGKKGVHNGEPDRIRKRLVEPAARMKYRCIRYPGKKPFHPSFFIEFFLYSIREIFGKFAAFFLHGRLP